MALTASTLAVRLLDGRRASRLLGQITAEDGMHPGASWTDAYLVGRSVELVASWLPWKPRCLPQAVATRWMLRRRDIPCETHLGVIGTDPFETHAWVTAAGRVVQGGPVDHVTELAVMR